MAGRESAPATASEDDRSLQTTPLVDVRTPPAAPGPDVSELPPEGGAIVIIASINLNSPLDDAAARAAASVEALHLESTSSGVDEFPIQHLEAN